MGVKMPDDAMDREILSIWDYILVQFYKLAAAAGAKEGRTDIVSAAMNAIQAVRDKPEYKGLYGDALGGYVPPDGVPETTPLPTLESTPEPTLLMPDNFGKPVTTEEFAKLDRVDQVARALYGECLETGVAMEAVMWEIANRVLSGRTDIYGRSSGEGEDGGFNDLDLKGIDGRELYWDGLLNVVCPTQYSCLLPDEAPSTGTYNPDINSKKWHESVKYAKILSDTFTADRTLTSYGQDAEGSEALRDLLESQVAYPFGEQLVYYHVSESRWENEYSSMYDMVAEYGGNYFY